MILRELFEVRTPNSVAIMFGRFNPPHFGHVAAWEVAAQFPNWYIGTNQSTQGPKDPLPFSIKIEAMRRLYPEIVDHLVAEQSWFTLAVMAFKKHGPVTLHIVTDSKDVAIYLPMIQKQNGIEGPHGYYKFKSIEWAEAERKSEASLVRKAVRENNLKDFEKYALNGNSDIMVAGTSYFTLVRQYMLPYMQAEEEKLKKQQEKAKEKPKAPEKPKTPTKLVVKPTAKPPEKKIEKDKPDDKKVKQPDQSMAEVADNKNTGAVSQLKSALLTNKQKIQQSDADDTYNIIDRLMTKIARSHDISGKQLHDMWVKQYKQIPDKWIMRGRT